MDEFLATGTVAFDDPRRGYPKDRIWSKSLAGAWHGCHAEWNNYPAAHTPENIEWMKNTAILMELRGITPDNDE